MDRIIEVKIDGNYLSKDNKNAGVRGEGNVTQLRIAFDAGWQGYAKKVAFWDAHGCNPVERTLTTDLLENIVESTEIYLVPIPPEAMAEAGMLTFVVDGYIDGKRQRSLADKLEVKDAPIAEDAGEPTDPTPTQAEQMQTQIDSIITDIRDAVEAKVWAEDAKGLAQIAQAAAENSAVRAEGAAGEAEISAATAETYASKAYEAIGKTSYVGANGNWYEWDGSLGEFIDTEVRAQAGSTVYYGDNPPPEADVWIKPDGEGVPATYPVRAFVNILGGADNWIAEDVFGGDGGVIGVRYGQIVNVNNAVITPNSKVDLQITSEQMVIFYEKDLAFVAENEDGVVTIYCIGNVPENDYTLQATVTEVTVNG